MTHKRAARQHWPDARREGAFSMARLNLDFHAASHRAGVRVILLLLVGGLALTWVASHWLSLRDKETQLNNTIGQMTYRPPVARAVLPADAAAKVARERVREQMTASWQPPFEALFAIQNGKIALISFDASQAKRSVKIVAEARQLADVVDYVEALQQQPRIRRAVLTQHEFQTDADQQPVRFHVTLEWRT